ncbi:MAG TPA: O-antigen ligase family protein [Ideonella sp.]|nr:O-antigen ligase family protein [Ideonella sp.]
MSQLVLLGVWIYVLALLANDSRRREGLSLNLWTVALWVALIGSRPVSTWFDFGVSGGGQAEAYDEGNPFERVVYFVLIFHAVWVLLRRGVRVGEVVRNNRWLFVFFLYWGLSVLWADLPVVALKRWIKDIGNILMVLVVLTEANPSQAVKAVFARAACVLIPVSFLFIRFFPSLGRTYHVWSGEMMYTGVTTHKNSLGVLAMVCLLFLVTDFVARLKQPQRPRWFGLLGDLSLIGLAAWLLLKANSATAMVCATIGFFLLVVLRSPGIQKKMPALEISFGLLGLLLWATDAINHVARFVVVDILERDLTLTTRTEVWPMLIQRADNPLLGAGFNSFWSGERLASIYQSLGIIQAHNGYLETYLNGGIVAIVLLGFLLLSAGRSINRAIAAGDSDAHIRMAFFVIAVVYNCTEASFNKIELLWFAFLIAIVRYPAPLAAVKKLRGHAAVPRGRPPAATRRA